ncbi:GNAT family N-acetyltransferase [Actinocrispum wychmicini]|uniref:Acetyltransferase (GNAT) family protein n=1 Tax=Actinocrispum wychmicini TaxID=1213861 RepID=A0A4R2JRW2_9PSEU|nr:GNAT family N-acetyltransferase [Actinocrispum wychmicini]TCO63013.1 acetyltransferase (GNAT) family protein [Actinocrispum wychmicini]
MEARVHETVETYKELVGPLLAADPIRHTIMLTAVDRAGEDALMITLHDNGSFAGAVIQVPPYPLLTSALPLEATELVAETIQLVRPELTGATGPLASVEPFVRAWTERTGTTAELRFGSRLFELDELKPPIVRGDGRVGTEADLDLLIDWRQRFMAEAVPGAPGEPAEAAARKSLELGAVNVIWEVDGEPVAFAGARGPFEGMVRVSPVYTPPEHRGHGYASAATAAASRWALDQGADHVLLFTDLGNPVTNRIYPRIGYRPLMDSAEYMFK